MCGQVSLVFYFICFSSFIYLFLFLFIYFYLIKSDMWHRSKCWTWETFLNSTRANWKLSFLYLYFLACIILLFFILPILLLISSSPSPRAPSVNLYLFDLYKQPIGGKLKVINGAYRGEAAVLLGLDVDTFSAKIKLTSGSSSGKTISSMPYEDICKIHAQ